MFSTFPKYVCQLVDAGVPVTLKRDPALGYYLDLHLEAKSHMYLYNQDGKWLVDMRYDETHAVESFDDLLDLALRGMYGRPYVNEAWARLLGVESK